MDEFYAMQLSGVHIGKRVRATWRFKSWKDDRPDYVIEFTIKSLAHKANGKVSIDHEKTVKPGALFKGEQVYPYQYQHPKDSGKWYTWYDFVYKSLLPYDAVIEFLED